MYQESIWRFTVRLTGATWLLIALGLAWIAVYGDAGDGDAPLTPAPMASGPVQASASTAPAVGNVLPAQTVPARNGDI